MTKYDDKFLQDLISSMSIREKAAQITQFNTNIIMPDENGEITGPAKQMHLSAEDVAACGSTLNFKNAEVVKRVQEEHLRQDKRQIPICFMQDVIHGYRTIYPVPLALGCCFEPELVRELSEMAALESVKGGVHVTFAPMADLARDARWGRVVETTGEDPYMNYLYANAAVKGFQGEGETIDENHVAACLKHFMAYGASEAGRDYNTVDLSERTLREYYLSGYKGAVDAGVAMAMTSFNVFDGVPMTANKKYTKGLLKDEWGWDGVIISDYNAFGEMRNHGYMQKSEDIALRAFEAGEDIEMMSTNYMDAMEKLIADGKITEEQLDAVVMKVLKFKRDLGLFDDPLRGANYEEEQAVCLCEEHREKARRAAEKCTVLLKNDGILPLKEGEKVALIGPFADYNRIYGTWGCHGTAEETVTVLEGIKKFCSDVKCAAGCGVELFDADESGFKAAIKMAKKADKVVLCLGEEMRYSGESCSRADITVPAIQIKLLKAIKKVNDNIAVVTFGGRPLVLTDILPEVKALAFAWQPGTEGGNAIANLLYGKVNFSAKLSMSFPRHGGQCPIYYNWMNTGRPNPDGSVDKGYCTRYMDLNMYPLLPYGYGLSYSTFEISEITLSGDKVTADKPVTASVNVKNTSSVDGAEVVQLYIHDKFATRVRPGKELKGYEKVWLKAGESKTVKFEINEEMLRFWDENMQFVSEKGEFELYIGSSSDTKNKVNFELV